MYKVFGSMGKGYGMKSGRESALANKTKVKPRNVTMPKEAMKIAVRLETARNYKDKTRYNNILKKLADEYPEMAEEIMKLKSE
jgi:hypothetical protein